MEYKMLLAVQKICERVGDVDYKNCCTNTAVSGYDGRAKSAFWESVFGIISDMYKDKTKDEKTEGESASISNIFSQEDIKGLITIEENISLSSATGKLLYSALAKTLYKIIDIFPNPDNSDSLSMFLKRINIDYFKGIKGEDLVPDDTLYWYPVGDGIQFYPKGDIPSAPETANKVSIMYVRDINISDWDYYGGPPNGGNGDDKNLTNLFSVAFIYKAIGLASMKIENEKEKI